MENYKIIGTINTIKKEVNQSTFTINNTKKYSTNSDKKIEYNIMVESKESNDKEPDFLDSKIYKSINIKYEPYEFEKIILKAKERSYKVEVIK